MDVYGFEPEFTATLAKRIIDHSGKLQREYKTNQINQKRQFLEDRISAIENEVKNDMIVQQRWVEIMKPRYSILKFRLPWNEEQFLYLDGKIVIQPWGPQSSTETRLIINDSLKKFNLKSFVNKNKIQSYMSFFELDYLLKEIPEDRIKNKNERYLIQVKKNEKKPLVYELPDLCRLHWLVLSRRVFNTLEIGSGFSTIFIADAKYILKKYFKKVENIRCEKQFHIYSVGENKHFLNITKKRIPKNLSNYISLIF